MRLIIVGNMLKCDKRVFVSCYHSWSSQNRQLMLFVICHGCKYAGVWRVSGRCLDGVWKVFCLITCLVYHYSFHESFKKDKLGLSCAKLCTA